MDGKMEGRIKGRKGRRIRKYTKWIGRKEERKKR